MIAFATALYVSIHTICHAHSVNKRHATITTAFHRQLSITTQI